ncbi:MAG: hypothetical protein QOH88_1921 [Verrucomicrobiota bacterium]|jgi:uncharacterized protein YecT (DUF1311 family)
MRTTRVASVLAVALALLATAPVHAGAEAAELAKAKRRFATADAELNKTFATLRKTLPADEFKDLRDGQRKWLEHRDYISADQPRQNGFHGDDPKKSADYWTSMAELTESRTEFLRAAYDRSLPSGITGSYGDSFGGSLDLEERKEGVAFQINVVRGPTSHTGGLSGVATLKGDTAAYKEVVEPGEDRAPCELTFTFSKGHVVKLDGKNTDYYHGMRAYFVGTYFKVGKLEKPIDLNAKPDE